MAVNPDARAQPARDSSNTSVPGSGEEMTPHNVDRNLALEAADHGKATVADRVADAITSFSGSMRFVWITVVSVGGWVVFNLALPEPARFDPFPFPLLTLVLSVEAIFLAIFILISQNRAARVTEKRSHLDLQLNLPSEQENTKMLLMLEQIGNAVGAKISGGPDVSALSQATRPEALSEQIDRAVEAGEQRPAGGP
jgi:uncharacterized membrane protein